MKIVHHQMIARHHVVPSSRKKNNKTIEVEHTFHNAWHICFRNLTVEEIKVFIDIVMRVDGKIWTKKKLQHLRNDIMKGKVKKYEVINKSDSNSESSGCVLQEADVYEENQEE